MANITEGKYFQNQTILFLWNNGYVVHNKTWIAYNFFFFFFFKSTRKILSLLTRSRKMVSLYKHGIADKWSRTAVWACYDTGHVILPWISVSSKYRTLQDKKITWCLCAVSAKSTDKIQLRVWPLDLAHIKQWDVT